MYYMLFYLFITILIFILIVSFAINSMGYLQEAIKNRVNPNSTTTS